MKKDSKKKVVRDCQNLFNLFNQDSGYVLDHIDDFVYEPYCRAVIRFLEKNNKKMVAKCSACFYRLMAVSFSYGFVAGSMINPNSKTCLKTIKGIKKALEPALL